MSKNNKFSVGGLFSGVGGIEKGFQNAGFEIFQEPGFGICC